MTIFNAVCLLYNALTDTICKRQCYVSFSKHWNRWNQLWYILIKFSLSLIEQLFSVLVRVCFSYQFLIVFFFPENINLVKPEMITIYIDSLYFLYFLADMATMEKAVQKYSLLTSLLIARVKLDYLTLVLSAPFFTFVFHL